MGAESVQAAYAAQGNDAVRAQLETGFFGGMLPGLLAQAGGGRVLDLGCGDGLAAALAGPGLTEYTGVDFRSSAPLAGNACCTTFETGSVPSAAGPSTYTSRPSA